MGNLDIKSIKEMKNNVTSAAGKGFGYFMKNALLVFLIFMVTYILANPDLLKNPVEYFKDFDATSWYGIGVLVICVIGIYQVSRNILKGSTTVNSSNIAKEVVGEQKKEEERKASEHIEKVKQRMKDAPVIESLLKDIIIDLKASRALVLEMHNGTNSFTGSPFLFADANWEVTNKDVDYISDDYKNFSLTKYPFVMNHFEDGTWIGPIEEIESEDPRLASKLEMSGADFAAAIVLQGVDAPIGFLVVSFVGRHPSKTDIIAELNQKAQVISTILDK